MTVRRNDYNVRNTDFRRSSEKLVFMLVLGCFVGQINCVLLEQWLKGLDITAFTEVSAEEIYLNSLRIQEIVLEMKTIIE